MPNPEQPPKAPLVKAVKEGPLTIADFEIRCYVLDTPQHERVVSRQDLLKALGRTANPPTRAPGKVPIDNTPSFLDATNLQPFISKELRDSTNPIPFANLKGNRMIGYNAEILRDVCFVFIDAAKAGVLKPHQLHIAERCELMIRAFASVGIRALVDEATGFQELRPRDDLQRYLDTFLLKEYAKWVRRFPPEFFEGIFRMKGWDWDEASTKRPGIVGTYINDLVYKRLAPLILEQLRIQNPVQENGRRKTKYHQWLTPDVGHPKLQEHLQGVMAIQRVAGDSWPRFMHMMDAAYPRFGHTLPITFRDIEEDEHNKRGAVPFDEQLKGLLNVPPPAKDDDHKDDDPKDGSEPDEDAPAPKKPKTPKPIK